MFVGIAARVVGLVVFGHLSPMGYFPALSRLATIGDGIWRAVAACSCCGMNRRARKPGNHWCACCTGSPVRLVERSLTRAIAKARMLRYGFSTGCKFLDLPCSGRRLLHVQSVREYQRGLRKGCFKNVTHDSLHAIRNTTRRKLS